MFQYWTDGSDASLPFKAEYILSGSTNSDTYTASYFENKNMKKRNWSMYEDSTLALEGSARIVSYDEIDTISSTDNLRVIGMGYWLPKAGIGFTSDCLGYIDESRSIRGWISYNIGIRPVVSLKSNILATSISSGNSHNTLDTAWHLSIN